MKDFSAHRTTWTLSAPRLFLVFRLSALLFVTSLLTACSGRQAVPLGEIPPIVPPSQVEIRSTFQAIDGELSTAQHPLSQKGPRYERARKITDRLLKAAGSSAGTIPVYILSSDEDVNAMAVNGSTMVVYSSLVDKVKSDEELAVILGHELGHVSGKHHLDKGAEDREQSVSIFSSILATTADVATTVATGSSGLGDVAGSATGGVTSVVGTGAFVRAYDRDMESEADQIGLMIMAKAGYDPRTAITFWARAGEIFGADINGFSFLSTHPSGDDRAAHLEEMMPVALKIYEESKAAPTPPTPAKKSSGKAKAKKGAAAKPAEAK